MKRRISHSFLLMVVYLLAGGLTSCINYRYIAEEQRIVPRFPDYSLKGKLEPGAAAGLLDSQAIYLSMVRNYDGTLYYHFYRFWEDGHILHRSRGMTEPPTQADAESFSGCDVGYYTIEGETVLIEMFIRYSGTWKAAEYLMSEAEIHDGDLVEKRSWIRHPLFKLALREYPMESYYVYRKVPMEQPLTRQPDW